MLWATFDYWGYRYVTGLSVEELGDYVAEHAQDWDNLDPAEVNVQQLYDALHEELSLIHI